MYVAENLSVIQETDNPDEIFEALQNIKTTLLGDCKQQVVEVLEGELLVLRNTVPNNEAQQRLFRRLELAYVETLAEIQK